MSIEGGIPGNQQRLVCPNCGKVFFAWRPDDLPGQKVKCYFCKHEVVDDAAMRPPPPAPIAAAAETPVPIAAEAEPPVGSAAPAAPAATPAEEPPVEPAAPAAEEPPTESTPPAAEEPPAEAGSSDELVALDTSSLTDLGPDGQQTLPVNNVLRNEI